MSYADYSAAEIGRRGQVIYDEQVRSLVEAENRGKFLVLDIDTGDYEINADDLTASDRLIELKPNTILYGVRVGFPSAYRLGGKTLVSKL